MQHLLDFIQDHSLEEQLYFVAQGADVALELLWKRADTGEHWSVRPYRAEGPPELVDSGQLIQYLEQHKVDMRGVRRELNAMLAAQIAFADAVLRDANEQLGHKLVERFVRANETFILELQAAVENLSRDFRPSLSVVHGGGERTQHRAGHLTLVR